MISKDKNSQTTAWTSQRSATLNCPRLFVPFGLILLCPLIQPSAHVLCVRGCLLMFDPGPFRCVHLGKMAKTETSKLVLYRFLVPFSAPRTTFRPKGWPWHLSRVHSCNKRSPSQGLYPQVNPECLPSMWAFHSGGNSLLMGRGRGVRGFLWPHLFRGAPFTIYK